jgi:hypothetical protein
MAEIIESTVIPWEDGSWGMAVRYSNRTLVLTRSQAGRTRSGSCSTRGRGGHSPLRQFPTSRHSLDGTEMGAS